MLSIDSICCNIELQDEDQRGKISGKSDLRVTHVLLSVMRIRPKVLQDLRPRPETTTQRMKYEGDLCTGTRSTYEVRSV